MILRTEKRKREFGKLIEKVDNLLERIPEGGTGDELRNAIIETKKPRWGRKMTLDRLEYKE